MKNFHFKQKIINFFAAGGAYKQERLALTVILICFAVGGVTLPVMSKSLQAEGILQDPGTVWEDPSSGEGDVSQLEPSQLEHEENREPDAENEPDSSSSSQEGVDSSDSSNSSDSTQTGDGSADTSQGSSTGGGNTSSSRPSTGGSGAGQGSSIGGSSSSSSGSGGGSSSQPSTPPQEEETNDKVWVPPVYETIHHEAVYETRRVYVCNFCQAEFNSAGEFQVHKDENGG